jgi:O-antigen/teichoic acid export membrane protein
MTAASGTRGFLRQKLDRVLGDATLRGVALIGGGSALGQAAAVATTPILSRLYGPQAYGALAVFSSLLGVASILVTFRFEVAVPLPEDPSEARDIFILSTFLSVAMSALACLGTLVWLRVRQGGQSGPIFWHMSWLVPLGMLGIGCYQNLSYWAARQRLYKSISATRVTQQIASVGTQTGLCRLPPQGLGLILGYIVGQAFGLQSLYQGYRASRPAGPLPSFRRMTAVGKKYWNLSAYGTLTAVATSIGDGLPSLVLAKAYGLEVAGVYLMASRVLSLPTQMVGASVAQVFMGEASQRLRETPASLPAYFRKVHRNLRWAGLGILALGAICPYVLPWALGPKWHAAGIVTLILAPLAAVDITVRPLYNITVIANRPRLQLVTGFVPLLFSGVGLLLPIFLHRSDDFALFSYTMARVVSCVVIYLVYLRVADSIGRPATTDGAP